MKNKKRISAAILSFVLLLSSAMPAFAEEEHAHDEAQTPASEVLVNSSTPPPVNSR